MKRALLLAVVLCACHREAAQPPWRDPHSHAEPDRVAVRHLELNLKVDFEQRTLAGTALLSLVRHDRSAPLVLDDDGLAIQGVHACGAGELRYQLGPEGNGGRAIRIELPADPHVECVEVRYQTRPDAGALLWVEPSGTAGGDHPMLFTQSQAILARTWIPLQDSPSVRFSYDARIEAPAGFVALMSAENPREQLGAAAWTFRQTHPIPSYLMALAVGNFVFRPIGPRSGVYAEPTVVDAAAQEFGEVEAMMTAAEELYGPYRWGRYDMLVLPPSFPYGGMENPNLTFLTPTVITGDRALVSLIAHELAHSWSGNLATNSSWNETWLNEGITSYVEERIMEKLRGREYADMDWYLTRKSVERTVAEVGPLSPSTRLAHAYGADTPADDIPGDVAYDKGALFMRTLETVYGRDVFDPFLRGWFDRHAFQAVDTRQFIADATAHLGTRVNLGGWLYGTGLLPDAASTPSARAKMLEGAARELAESGRVPDATGWTSIDWSVFVRALPDGIAIARLDALDAVYKLTTTTNAEIGMHWLPRLVAADARDRIKPVQDYLLTIGRRRMIVPLYEAMVRRNEFWKALAVQTFEMAKSRYHPVTRETVAKIVTTGS